MQPGIESWHRFSAGSYYDPDNVSFGPIIGFDEHRVDPGAGFDEHGHRGVHILSWVLDGELRHQDADGRVLYVPPGRLLVQSAGGGIRHSETNASTEKPLRFLQIILLREAPASVWLDRPPIVVAGISVTVQPEDGIEPDASRFVHALDDGSSLVLAFGT